MLLVSQGCRISAVTSSRKKASGDTEFRLAGTYREANPLAAMRLVGLWLRPVPQGLPPRPLREQLGEHRDFSKARAAA